MKTLVSIPRESSEVNIDMRIGIHSGAALAGVIGLFKFQYDVWGNDVTIANKMEQTGKAGSVKVNDLDCFILYSFLCIGTFILRKQLKIT